MQQHLTRRPMTPVLAAPTPITDRLNAWREGDALATWNSSRGRVTGRGPRGGVVRSPGGEWDVLRATPITVRRSLAATGFLAVGGLLPDQMADRLRSNGCPAADPVAWYLTEAHLAVQERRSAHRVGRDLALAHAHGATSAFKYRDLVARQAGHRSYWHYRKSNGWVSAQPQRKATP